MQPYGPVGDFVADIECPFCQSTDTELISLFGQQLLTVQYYCNHCHTPFERVKGEDTIEDARRREQWPGLRDQ